MLRERRVVSGYAIGFDFDHTLGIDNKLERNAFRSTVAQQAKLRDLTLDASRAGSAIDDQIARYRAGRCSLHDAFSEAYRQTLGEDDPPEAFDAFRNLAVSWVDACVEPLPGATALLRELDRLSVPYAILTNGWNPLQQRKAERIGFDRTVFVSDDIGARKPSVAAFNVLRDYFDLTPGAIWYVGDDPHTDVAGAREAGMRAIWYDWERPAYPADIAQPTATVHTLGDIISVVLSAIRT